MQKYLLNIIIRAQNYYNIYNVREIVMINLVINSCT